MSRISEEEKALRIEINDFKVELAAKMNQVIDALREKNENDAVDLTDEIADIRAMRSSLNVPDAPPVDSSTPGSVDNPGGPEAPGGDDDDDD